MLIICWLVLLRRLLFVVSCLCGVRCVMFVVFCLLCVVCRLLFVVVCRLPVAFSCSLFVARCLLFVVGRFFDECYLSLGGMCCLLYVVWCRGLLFCLLCCLLLCVSFRSLF